ncbi:uncharacterized protein METZ01_LOCUS145936 [marine metagenome]|uniref:Uncharacterized protein n=1 Tax=marine metagenome TaxID=408172 RepID=A0A381ZW61_9ZZZZ
MSGSQYLLWENSTQYPDLGGLDFKYSFGHFKLPRLLILEKR